jgi:hypothetical protein
MAQTTFRTVTFRRPFVLGDHSSALPAGTYKIETDVRPHAGQIQPIAGTYQPGK